MEFVFHDSNNRDRQAHTLKNALRGAQLSLPSINDEHARQRPLGMTKATLYRFTQSRHIVIFRSPYLELPICRLFPLAVLNDSHNSNRIRPGGMGNVIRFDSSRSFWRKGGTNRPERFILINVQKNQK